MKDIKTLMIRFLSIVCIFLTMAWIPFGNSEEPATDSDTAGLNLLEAHGGYQILSRYAGLECDEITDICDYYIEHILLNTKSGELTIEKGTEPYISLDIKELPAMDTVLLKNGTKEQRYQASMVRIDGAHGGKFVVTIIDTENGKIVKEYRVSGIYM